MIARLYRIVPLLVVLAVIAAVVYLVVTFRFSSNRAKEVLIKVFTWLNIVLSALFLLATLYALVEANQAVAELTGSFLAVSLIALGVTRICNRVFIKNHPGYRHELNAEAEVINRHWWDVFFNPPSGRR